LAQPKAIKGIPNDHGLLLADPAQYYAISAHLERSIWFDGSQPFIVQYEVKHEKPLGCSGAYLKLMAGGDGEPFEQLRFNRDTPYSILFGPDNCGSGKDQILFSFAHKNPVTGKIGMKHLKNPPRTSGNTSLTALYTLAVETDQTFRILLNNEIVREGSLLSDFEPAVNPPEMIEDRDDVKPSWWDERELIADPTAIQSLGDEDPNWSPPLVANHKYNGQWSPRQIKNPEFLLDKHPNRFQEVNAVGIEVWTLEGGIVFDNIILTHDRNMLSKFTAKTWELKRGMEEAELKRLLESAMSSEEEKKDIGRKEHNWINAIQAQPGGIYEKAVCSMRNAIQVYNEDPETFKETFAQPIFFGCILMVFAAVILRAIAEWIASRKTKVSTKKIAEEEAIKEAAEKEAKGVL